MLLGFSPAQTAAGANDIGQFLRNLPFAARVGSWFFVHAGKTDGKNIAQLTGDLRSNVDASGFGAPLLSAADSMLEARLEKSAPQWWDATNDAHGLLSQWTQSLGVKHLVMGHQPGAVLFADGSKRAADQMVAKYSGLLFLIDTGLSVGSDGTGGSWLHVTGASTAGEAWEEFLPNGQKKPLEITKRELQQTTPTSWNVQNRGGRCLRVDFALVVPRAEAKSRLNPIAAQLKMPAPSGSRHTRRVLFFESITIPAPDESGSIARTTS